MHLYLSDINITWSTVHPWPEDSTSILFLKQGTSTYGNFSHFMMRTSLRLIQPLHLKPHFLPFHNSKDLSQELVHAN
jgi:hypothetical protein